MLIAGSIVARWVSIQAYSCLVAWRNPSLPPLWGPRGGAWVAAAAGVLLLGFGWISLEQAEVLSVAWAVG
jgi:hypothetical protein